MGDCQFSILKSPQIFIKTRQETKKQKNKTVLEKLCKRWEDYIFLVTLLVLSGVDREIDIN